MVGNEIFSFYTTAFTSTAANVSFAMIVYLDSSGRKFVNLTPDYSD